MEQQTQWPMAGTTRPTTIPGLAALACIWSAVVAISVFAPDLVSGSEHEHLPIAAFGTWIWGAVATRSIMSATLRLQRERGYCDPLVGQLTAVVSVVWLAAAVVSIFGPQLVTGSDPTSLPIAAMIAPVAAALLTGGSCEIAATYGSATATPGPGGHS